MISSYDHFEGTIDLDFSSPFEWCIESAGHRAITGSLGTPPSAPVRVMYAHTSGVYRYHRSAGALGSVSGIGRVADMALAWHGRRSELEELTHTPTLCLTMKRGEDEGGRSTWCRKLRGADLCHCTSV